MARPSNSTVDVMKALQSRMGRLRTLCESYAANAEQFAKDNASTNSIENIKPKNRGAASNKPTHIEMTSKMLAEAEKTKTLSQREPWTNMTHDAMKQLKGYLIDDGEALGWGIAHRVEYGKALEFAFDGKYAILRPTVEHFRAQFLEQAQEIMGRKV
jgi:hypothetical protein